MILILTSHDYEQTTDPVIDQLLLRGAKFMRLSLDGVLRGTVRLHSDVAGGSFWLDDVDIIREVGVVWYRRFFPSAACAGDALEAEYRKLFDFLFGLLSGKTWLPAYHAPAINKLHVLHEARRIGLRVPETMVTNDRDDLFALVGNHRQGVVSKPIDGVSYVMDGDHAAIPLTTRLEPHWLPELPQRFFPALFQEYIRKYTELKVFYLDGRFFPVALHAPDSAYTDVRAARLAGDVHVLPFRLEPTEENLLVALMRGLGLNTGTIDLLVDEHGKLVLLEVNPGGQFLHESQQANLDVPRAIAEWLIYEDAAREIIR